jgi:hypothetical protein
MCRANERREILIDLPSRYQKIGHIPFNTHKEVLQVMIYVLIQANDVPPVFMDEFGHQGHEARLVRTMYKKDCAIGHRKVIWVREDRAKPSALPAEVS